MRCFSEVVLLESRKAGKNVRVLGSSTPLRGVFCSAEGDGMF